MPALTERSEPAPGEELLRVALPSLCNMQQQRAATGAARVRESQQRPQSSKRSRDVLVQST
jgi:hypothetical protein